MIRIREFAAGDAEAVAAMCQALNRDEGSTDPCHFTAAAFARDGFGADPAFAGVIAERAGEPLGYALYCLDYDTDRLCRTVLLSDLYVAGAVRRRGLGRALMAAVAAASRRQGARAMLWGVRRDNLPARRFYEKIGATVDDQIEMFVGDAEFDRLVAEAGGVDGLVVRPATAADCPLLAGYLAALFADIGLPPVADAADRLRADGFGAAPAFGAVIAERDGKACGYALYWPTYDTDSASRGGWLSDLYVVPEVRRHGIARRLVAEVAARSAARGARYLVWLVHAHNAPALRFYRTFAEEWTEGAICLCDVAAFAALADEGRPGLPSPPP